MPTVHGAEEEKNKFKIKPEKRKEKKATKCNTEPLQQQQQNIILKKRTEPKTYISCKIRSMESNRC